MAKLHSYYILCPLIDQKSFLGAAKDKDAGNVIVTLGRNVVNTYRLLDQKQITGWTSKDHFTSVVTYCKEYDSYVGVFNNNGIKMWKDDVQDFEKLKKYKFPTPILQVLMREDKPDIIVMANGNCVSLAYGIENRKHLDVTSLLKESDIIMDVEAFNLNSEEYICYIIKNNENAHELITCPLRKEIGDIEKAKVKRITINRKEPGGVHMIGKFICNKGRKCVYVLWSDSKLTAYDFQKKIWKTIGHVPWLSNTTNVSFSWMGDRHLILFGTSTQGDNAILIAYNVILGVATYKYPMKMYFNDAKIYCYNNRIILEAGTHIGMIPYNLQSNRDLSSLLGSHAIAHDKATYADWGYGEVALPDDDTIRPLVELGITERAICANTLPALLEKPICEIMANVRQFSDIPESVIVSLLGHVAKTIEIAEPMAERDHINAFTHVEHAESIELLKLILNVPFSDAVIIPHLRNGLTMMNAVFLMNFISYSLLTHDDSTFDMEGERKLYDWCSLLLDAFYQQFLMSKNAVVTSALENMLSMVKELVRQVDMVTDILPYIDKLAKNKEIFPHQTDAHKLYSIDLINI